jgi:hypothetical protein
MENILKKTVEMATISSSCFKDYPMYSQMAWNSFNYFDNKPLYDLDWIMGKLTIENYEWERKKRLIILYTDKGLIPNFEMKNGSRGFPLHAVSRIHFFDKLIDKWQYNIGKFKSIADIEDLLIGTLDMENEFCYKNLSDFDFYLLFLRKGAEEDERLLKSKGKLPKRDLIKNNFDRFKKLIQYFEQNNYENLTEKEKNQIAKTVSSLKRMMGDQMIREIISYRSKCLLGLALSATLLRRLR